MRFGPPPPRPEDQFTISLRELFEDYQRELARGEQGIMELREPFREIFTEGLVMGPLERETVRDMLRQQAQEHPLDEFLGYWAGVWTE
jgi:hypothetical protein